MYRLESWGNLGSETRVEWFATTDEVWAAIGRLPLFSGYQVYDANGGVPREFIPY